MCLLVYLVTDSDLPERPWHKKHPAFHVERLKGKEKFLRALPGNNSYVLGSHTGCGCGFLAGDTGDPAKLAASRASRKALSEYVEGAVRGRDEVVLPAAWAGDEGKPAISASVTSKELIAYPWEQTWDAPHLLRVSQSD